MDLTSIGAVVVAVVAAVGAWASQKSASRASMIIASTSSRLEAEREAYERARAFDVATIQRQDEEITGLLKEIATLRTKLNVLEDLHIQMEGLRAQLMLATAKIQRFENLYPKWERLLHERANEPTREDDPYDERRGL